MALTNLTGTEVIIGLKAVLRSLLPARAWNGLRGTYHGWVRRYRSFDVDELRVQLAAVGIERGDVVVVHSSWDRFLGFDGEPRDVIEALLTVVGPSGTLVMPSMPFTGSAIDYAESGAVFDARRSPSAMGFLTEVFRRRKGVERSLHPTHSVCALGPMANDLIADHHLAETPCGVGSPWARLVDARAKLLFLGVGTGANTFLHAAEALLEPEWTELYPDNEVPLSGLTDELFEVRTRLGDGSVHVGKTRLFDRRAMARRDGTKVERWLAEKGKVRCGKIKGLTIKVLRADQVLDEMRRRGRGGEFVVESSGMDRQSGARS